MGAPAGALDGFEVDAPELIHGAPQRAKEPGAAVDDEGRVEEAAVALGVREAIGDAARGGDALRRGPARQTRPERVLGALVAEREADEAEDEEEERRRRHQRIERDGGAEEAGGARGEDVHRLRKETARAPCVLHVAPLQAGGTMRRIARGRTLDPHVGVRVPLLAVDLGGGRRAAVGPCASCMSRREARKGASARRRVVQHLLGHGVAVEVHDGLRHPVELPAEGHDLEQAVVVAAVRSKTQAPP